MSLYLPLQHGHIDGGTLAAFCIQRLWQPAAVAIKTTGAGDAFAGAFLAGILKGQSVLQAAQRGNKVALVLVSGLVSGER